MWTRTDINTATLITKAVLEPLKARAIEVFDGLDSDGRVRLRWPEILQLDRAMYYLGKMKNVPGS